MRARTPRSRARELEEQPAVAQPCESHESAGPITTLRFAARCASGRRPRGCQIVIGVVEAPAIGPGARLADRRDDASVAVGEELCLLLIQRARASLFACAAEETATRSGSRTQSLRDPGSPCGCPQG